MEKNVTSQCSCLPGPLLKNIIFNSFFFLSQASLGLVRITLTTLFKISIHLDSAWACLWLPMPSICWEYRYAPPTPGLFVGMEPC